MKKTILPQFSPVTARTFFTALACFLAALTLPAATTQTWNNGAANSTWDTTSLNWSGVKWTNGNDAVFGATGAGAITVSGTISVGNLTNTASGYSFSGGTLSVAYLSAANTWSNGADITISSGITADFSKTGGSINGSMTKLGANTLTLSGTVNVIGTNTSSGNHGILVNAGSLVLNGNCNFTNAWLLVNAATASATISGGTHNFTGTVNRRGLAMGGNGGSLTVSGGNVTTAAITVGNGSSATYTQSGGTVTAALVTLGSAGNSGSTSVLNLDGGILQAVQLAPASGWLGTSTINLNGGTFQATGSSANLFSPTVTGSQPGSVVVKVGGAVIDSNGNNTTNSSALLHDPALGGTADGGLIKLGGVNTTLTLSGASTYTGGTTISGGILVANNNSALGTGPVTNAGTRLVVNDGITIANDITINANTGSSGVGFGGLIQNSGTGTATLNGGTITINNSPAAGGHFYAIAGGTIDVYDPINSSVAIVMRGDTTGKLILRGGGSYTTLNHQNGKVALGANDGISTSAAIGNFGANGAAIFDLAGYNQTLVGMTKGANSATISNSVASSTSVLTTTGTSTYGGTIVDGTATAAKVALTVNGGSLTLTNKNTYSGATTINNGSLVGVGGGSCSNSAVSVAATSGNSATLGVSITDNTKSWTCASLTVDNTAGTSSGLNFDFTAGSPSATVAPLVITGAAIHTTTPTVTVALGAVTTITAGNSYPLIARASFSGTEPTAVTVTTTTSGAIVTAHLAVTGTTNYLVIDSADSLKTWDNGSGNFTWDITSTNWSGAVWADGIDAVFGATGVGAITVSGTRSVGNLTITNNGYSFSGGTLSVANLSAANTWSNSSDTTISSGVTADFSKPGGAITGTLTKVGAGTLTLSGAVNATGTNTSSGNFGITVSAGSLVLNGTTTFSNAALFAAAAGASVTFSGGTHNFTGTVNRKGLSIGGNGGAITVSGGNVTTLNLTVGNGSSATFTQSGGTVAATSVQVGAAGNSGSTSVFNLDGGIFQSVQLAPSAGWLGTSTINLNGGTFQASGSSTNLFSATIPGSQPGSILVQSGGAVIDTAGFSVTQGQPLLAGAGAGGLTKLGLGTLTLSGVNTYTGPTTISNGKLLGGVGGSSASSVVTVAATAGNTAALGVSVTDNTLQWTCSNVTINNAGVSSGLDFNFGTIAPSTSVAPLNVTGAAAFTTTPAVTVELVATNVTVGGVYPLMTWVSASGTAPTSVAVVAPGHSLVTGHLTVTGGNTLNLVIDTSTSLEPLSWAGGDGIWDLNNSTNLIWQDNASTSTYFQAGDSVVFDNVAGSGGTVTLNTLLSPLSVTVSNTATYTFSGSGGLAGAISLTKSGPGALTLATSNTYSLGTVINAGTVNLGAGGTMGDLGTGSISNNAALVVNRSDAPVFAQVISGTGSLTMAGSGTLTLSGANTYTGNTAINAGALGINVVSTESGGTILSGATGVGNVTLAGGITLPESSKLWYAPMVTLTGDITLAGTLRQQVGFKTLDLSGGTRTLHVNPTGGNVKQTITGNMALEGTGRSRWEMLDISDTHPFTNNPGTLTITNGTLALDSNLTGNNYAGFMIQFPSYFANNAGLTVGPNVHFQTVDGYALGTNTTDSATLTVNGIWNLGGSASAGAIPVGDQAIYSLAGSGRVYASMTNNGGNPRTIFINGTAGSTTFSGSLNDGPGTSRLFLTKTGGSTQTLSGTNTYTGTTTVSSGTLLVNGILGTNTVTVNTSGALGGTGSIGGDVTFASGALAVFTNGAPLTFNGAVILNNNTVHLNLPASLGAGTYLLATNTVAGISGSFASTPVVDIGSVAGTASITNTASAVSLVVVSTGPSGSNQLTNSITGGGSTLSLSWGSGWTLQRQTNSLSQGLGTNWQTYVAGIAGITSTNISMDKTNSTVFYRLVFP